MDNVCGCGGHQTRASRELTCLKCGVVCCPSCAFVVDSFGYCARCAESILDSEGVPLSLSAPADWIWSQATRADPPRRSTSEDRAQWIILVARDQADLFAHLVGAFARDDKVAIVLDRRKDYSRNPPGLEDRLRTHGAAVIRRRAR